MLDKNGFDLWADGYDKTVGISDEDDSYPFAGYKNVLAFIYRKILEHNSAVLLDIGFGTGTLTAKLYEQGCEIYGQDFSAKMLELAQAKMPEAHLYQGDFSKGLAEPLLQRHYDSILATYSLHHLTDDEKIRFLQLLKSLLKKADTFSSAMSLSKPKTNCRNAVRKPPRSGMKRNSISWPTSCGKRFQTCSSRKYPIAQASSPCPPDHLSIVLLGAKPYSCQTFECRYAPPPGNPLHPPEILRPRGK
nr:class I SAM-dependent methyltransferase [uncultured Acetatifactor sp.]